MKHKGGAPLVVGIPQWFLEYRWNFNQQKNTKVDELTIVASLTSWQYKLKDLRQNNV